MTSSTIIYLNGASSSGKTTLAHALQHGLDEPYFHLSIDVFAAMVFQRTNAGPAFSDDVVGPKLNWGFVHCVASLAAVGNNVIVDDVLCESLRLDGKRDAFLGPDLLQQRVQLLAPYGVLYVGVHCALPELQQRERARGDRYIGLAEFQYERVHRYSTYDVAVDTSLHTPEACAQQISRCCNIGPHRALLNRCSMPHIGAA